MYKLAILSVGVFLTLCFANTSDRLADIEASTRCMVRERERVRARRSDGVGEYLLVQSGSGSPGCKVL